MKKLTRRFVLGSSATALGLWLVRPKYALESRLRPSGKRLLRPRPQPGGDGLPGSTAATNAMATVEPQETAPPPWEALAPYGPGDTVAKSWSVHELSGVQNGSAIVTLRHASGQQAHLRLMRRGLVPIGVAQTAELDLLLMNHSRGGEPTNEPLARVIHAFTAVIDDHAKDRPAPRLVMASLDAPPSHYC